MTQEKPRLEALKVRLPSAQSSLKDHAYTAVIRKLRWILPIAAMGIVAALMIWPKVQLEISQKRFEPAALDQKSLEKASTENKLTNAKFNSVDGKGRPFTILANEATQDGGNADNIHLVKPRGTLTLDETESMTGKAETGLYNQKDQVLVLHDQVVLTRSDGMVMRSGILAINLQSKEARGNMPVAIDGPLGNLTAQAFDMRQEGAVIIFKGPAKLVINQKNSKKGANR